MKVTEVTLEVFEAEAAVSGRGQRSGANVELINKATKTPLKLEFEDAAKAQSKLSALYMVRRKLNAQVKIIKRDNWIMLAPGEFVAHTRKATPLKDIPAVAPATKAAPKK